MPKLRDNPLVQVVDELTRTQGRLRHLFAGVRAESGLGSTDNLVLAAILEANTPPTVPQIGRSLGHPRQVIQRAVNKLEQEGYIEKRPNPDHKRAPLLTATTRGIELKQGADELALQIADSLLAGADPAVFNRLTADLREAREAIEAFLRERGDAR
jgi:DNA-binding MarR family transcriptional regulator